MKNFLKAENEQVVFDKTLTIWYNKRKVFIIRYFNCLVYT